MKRNKIIFRADGNSEIGLGHVMRSLALAEMLNANFDCEFATRFVNDFIRDQIKSVCTKLHVLPNEENKHFDYFLDFIEGDEIIVLDNYFFTTEYQQLIKEKGCKLVCIDDMYDKHFVSDVVINHALGISHDLYSTEKYTKLLLGYKYALLRSEYLGYNHVTDGKKYDCVIMMGGSDPLNITLKLVSILKNIKRQLPIAIISNVNNASSLFNGILDISYFNNLQPNQVIQVMSQSKFGIFPASTVALEACAARLPFICGYFVDNQINLYRGINENKLALCVNNFGEIDISILTKAINNIGKDEVVKRLIKNQKNILDKKSKERFINVFNEL